MNLLRYDASRKVQESRSAMASSEEMDDIAKLSYDYSPEALGHSLFWTIISLVRRHLINARWDLIYRGFHE